MNSCVACECNNRGSIGVSCDIEGKCQCRPNFDGIRCEQCKEGLYNFPICEGNIIVYSHLNGLCIILTLKMFIRTRCV